MKAIDPEEIEHKAEQDASRQVRGIRPFYAQVPTALLRSSRLKPQAKALYALIHSYCKQKDLQNHPTATISIKTMEKDFNLSDVSIRIHLNSLKKEGWIDWKRQGRMRPNKYSLFPSSKRDWEAIVAMKRVEVILRENKELEQKLKKSIIK